MPTPVLDGTEQLFFEPFADLFSTPLEEPTPPAAEELERSLAHVWIVAAEIKVEERVAKLADFRNEGFEKTRAANGTFDLTVGNVP